MAVARPGGHGRVRHSLSSQEHLDRRLGHPDVDLPSDEQVAHRAAVPPVGDTHDLEAFKRGAT